MDEKKPHTLEVQLMRITGGNMNCINLVIPKILFILVLWDHPMENFLTIVTSWRRGEAGEGGGGEGAAHAILCQKFLKLWYWFAEKYFLLFI